MNDYTFRQRRFCVEENSTAAQVLGKSVHGASVKLHRQRRVHFKTLRTTALQTIRICAHRFVLSEDRAFNIRAFAEVNFIADWSGGEVLSESTGAGCGNLWGKSMLGKRHTV